MKKYPLPHANFLYVCRVQAGYLFSHDRIGEQIIVLEFVQAQQMKDYFELMFQDRRRGDYFELTDEDIKDIRRNHRAQIAA